MEVRMGRQDDEVTVSDGFSAANAPSTRTAANCGTVARALLVANRLTERICHRILRTS